MNNFVNTVDVVGDVALMDSIIDRTITEYKDNILTEVGFYALGRCDSLTIVDLPKLIRIDAYGFSESSALKALILRNEDQVCSLYNNMALGAGIRTGTGYVYVPSSLKEQYASETNWSASADKIRALEDWTVDGTIWGELDWDKINAA